MKNKNLSVFVYLFFLFFVIAGVYVNFMNYRSNQVQVILFNSLNKNEYNIDFIERFQNFNPNFPNLSQTALPIKAMMARFYLFKGDYSYALQLLNESLKVNPYIMFNESEKALVYDNLQIKDSFIHYSKKAFYKIPQNERHFIQYAKALIINSDSIELDNSYNKVKNSDISFLHLSYLATNFAINRDFNQISNNVQYILDKFTDNEEIRLTANYIKYGKENVDKAFEISRQANEMFLKGGHEGAGLRYIEASKLNPSDYTHFENAGVSLYFQEKYDEAIPYFKKVIDSLNPKIGKSEYLLGSSYELLGDFVNACKYYKLSSELNFRLAFDAQAKLCFK